MNCFFIACSALTQMVGYLCDTTAPVVFWILISVQAGNFLVTQQVSLSPRKVEQDF